MDRKQYSMYAALICAVIGAATGLLIVKEKALVAVIFLLMGSWLIRMLKSKVKDIMEDEMIHAYAAKAAQKTMDFYGISLTILGLILLGLKNAYPRLEVAGYTILYSICYMLVLHFIFYYFLKIKLMGENDDDKK